MARKILLADDSVTAQNMGRRILTDAGYDVVTVNNGSAALKKIAELKPDLVILDVYMPGYGGLELCQKLREGRETARIPILLTVGKLEPFKADEARRVRADAYIVKPFEATELLTALTKLEDKIVPQPEPYKPGRFAKAAAAIENNNDNADAGLEPDWQERLKIPSGPKLVEREPKSGKGRGRKQESAESEVKSQSTEIPADITPEEMNAIAAAAAALKTVPGEQDAASSEPQTISTTAEAVATPAVAEAPVASDAIKGAVEVPAPGPQAPVAAAEVQPKAPAEPAKAPEFVTEASSSQTAEEKPADAEVLAALATLGVNDSAGSAHPPEAVAMASTAHGPRWIAEEVPVSENEGTFILEHEMEKAYAALAAAEGKATYTAFAVAEACAPADEAATASVPERSVDASAENQAQPPKDVAEAGRVSAAWGEPATQEAPQTVQPSPTSEAKPEAAFAAAASAGDASIDASATPGNPAEPCSPETHRVAPDVRSEGDLAAAWAHWTQIRDTVVNLTSTDGAREPIAMAPVAEQQQEQPTTEPQPESVAANSEPSSANPEPAAPYSEAISQIVDNMLAELKPKLMEELARKLAAEKK